MSSRVQLRAAAGLLVALHLAILLAGFVGPYDPAAQDRALPFAPPTGVHFIDATGRLHLRPFIYPWRESESEPGTYVSDTHNPSFIRLFVPGSEYNMLGILPCKWHLFAVEAPARILLLGSDAYGRDQFSRVLYGGQISLLAGILAALISLALGALVGTLAGFVGGWPDAVLMRSAELFLALPWLYLLFAVRAFLPLSVDPRTAFFLVVGIIGLVGWVRPARLVRGLVLSSKERKYVLAARGFGASDLYLLRRHIVPSTYPVLLTQATLLIPQFILAEVTLSFLGLGVAEPVPSWGNMLASLQQYHVIVSYWWMTLPGLALVLVFLGYLSLADVLEKRMQSAPL